MKNIRWKPILNWAGFAIGIVGVIFVALKLYQYSDNIHFSSLSFLTLALILGLSFTYGCANILLSIAWRDLLLYFGVQVNLKCAIQIYGVSQIAKYIPGNIFQFAGRQAIGQSANIPAKALIKSSFWEIGLLAFTGIFFSVLLLPVIFKEVSYTVSVLIFVVLIVVSNIFIQYNNGLNVSKAIMKYLLFLILSAVIFNIILMSSNAVFINLNLFIIITGAYIFAWLAGLFTPGAPAGIGVREVVILTMLHSFINEGELLKAIILGRFVTVGGDVLFYLFSTFLRLTGKGCPVEKSA